MKARLNSPPGFTLVELMVVMAIIAILATAGISGYTGYINKAILLGGRVFATKLERSFFEDAVLRLDFEGNNRDTSGHNYHASAGGTYEAGANGQGVILTGQSITVLSNTDLDAPSFTYALWVKPYSLNCATNFHYAGCNIILIREDYEDTGFRFGITSDGTVDFWASQSGGVLEVNGDKRLRIGQWNHIAITYDGAQGTLYVNGQMDTPGNGGSFVIPTGVNLSINGNVGNLGYSNMSFDDLRFYSSSFLAGDIEKMYQDGTSKYLAQR